MLIMLWNTCPRLPGLGTIPSTLAMVPGPPVFQNAPPPEGGGAGPGAPDERSESKDTGGGQQYIYIIIKLNINN